MKKIFLCLTLLTSPVFANDGEKLIDQAGEDLGVPKKLAMPESHHIPVFEGEDPEAAKMRYQKCQEKGHLYLPLPAK